MISRTLAPDSALARIARATLHRVEAEKREGAMRRVLEKISLSRQPHAVLPAFAGPGIHVIAEIKRQSPSQGPIAPTAEPVEVAREYLTHGATMLSVLTERDFFGGDPRFLEEVRKAHPMSLLLMKDFVLDEYQIARARELGADAVLLIAALLDEARLERLKRFAEALDLTPLIEVHDEAELTTALSLNARFIGVNNRDLKTLKVSLDISRALASRIPPSVTAIAESGIRTADDVRELTELGYRGVLVGTSLMETGSPGAALARLLGSDL